MARRSGVGRNNPNNPNMSSFSLIINILVYITVGVWFIFTFKAAFYVFISLIVIGLIFFCLRSFSKDAIGEQDTQVFTPTDELAALLQRQKLRDKLKYLGCSDGQELLEKYPMCLTDVEKQDIVNIIQNCRNLEQQTSGQRVIYEYDDENRPVINWSKQKPIEYDDDDTYDNFYMQHEDEFKEMWGKDDYEDAIEDAWEEHQRDKEQKKRWGR